MQGRDLFAKKSPSLGFFLRDTHSESFRLLEILGAKPRSSPHTKFSGSWAGFYASTP
jgi:hypothetical protein